jgi:PqqD family protein of HPr-rel-A system
MGGTEKTWRASQLFWKSWEDGEIVFNVASGNTHLLTPLAAQVLHKLEKLPASSYELAEALAMNTGLKSDENLVMSVEELLANLDELGLIESIS